MAEREGAEEGLVEPTPVTPTERRARMLLTRIVEPGDVDACRLVRAHGAEALLDRVASRTAVGRDGPDLGGKVTAWAERLRATDPDDVISRAEATQARLVCPGDDEWPVKVDELVLAGGHGERRGGAPFALWVQGAGDLGMLTGSSVAVVGARAATAYGEHVAGDLALGCAVAAWTVVSGGAYGIDAAAHRGALAANRPTVSVLAGGIDRLYPAGHAPMLRRILAHGCLVSEAAPGCAPTRSRFLVRNRLIAALTDGTVVVEAAVRSGSLNTARWADDLGRAVMGVPGPVTSATSRGVHELLRGPTAVLVTAADEVIEHLSPVGTGLAPRREEAPRAVDGLGPESRRVLDAVPRHDPAPAESIALVAGLARATVQTRLDRLARDGWVHRTPSELWCRTERRG